MDNINSAISEPSRSGRPAISHTLKADNTGNNGKNDEVTASEKPSFSDSMDKVAKEIRNSTDATGTKADGKNLPVSENPASKTASEAAEDDRLVALDRADAAEINTISTGNLLSASNAQLLQSEPKPLTEMVPLVNSLPEQTPLVLNDIGAQLEVNQLSTESAILPVEMSDIQVSQLIHTEVSDAMTSAIVNPAANATVAAIGVAASGMSLNRQAAMPEIRSSNISLNGQNTPLASQLAANTDVQASVLLPASSAALDDIAALAQKNQLSAQLSGLSGQTSTNTSDNGLSQLLQAAGLSADSTNATLSASLNNASNNVTPLNFNAVTQAASQVASQSASLTSSQALFQGEIVEPFGRPAWSQSMGKQVLMMVNQNINSAEIRLNPASLGPIEVRIEMSDDQINVALSSRSAAVREAMEMALPKLREMLGDSGMNLAGTDISQHSFAEQREQNTSRENNLFNRSINQVDPGLVSSEVMNQVELSNSMVDYYI